MDPCRIRSYLQVACAGLGFEIGEIWWTGNENGSSSVAAIAEEKPHNNDNNYCNCNGNGDSDDSSSGDGKNFRFVQLYTSKSYENRRGELVNPPDDGGTRQTGDELARRAQHHQRHEHEHNHDHMHEHPHQHSDHECCTTADLEKHKLSPRLVDAISKTAQVVWANTLKQEGLTGRSDIPLHTAVGMPVAVDADGNMCIVVMFSPSNIQSTDAAMEYLQSISRSATSSSIPCLMPAFDNTDELQHVPTARKNAIKGLLMPETHSHSLGDGVTAKYVSIKVDTDNDNEESKGHTHGQHTNNNNDLSSAPKDCFGIPMLPSFSQIGNEQPTTSTSSSNGNMSARGRLDSLGNDDYLAYADMKSGRNSPNFEDVFDEASYGVWSTIMRDQPATNETTIIASAPAPPLPATTKTGIPNSSSTTAMVSDDGIPMGINEGEFQDNTDPTSLVTTHKRLLDPRRKVQLEEFCTAFLGMSIFDIADVWIPAGPEHPGCLSHVTTKVTTSNQSNAISEFKRVSGYTLIQFWSGAVGRAFSSGHPVWSCNPDVYIDKGRSEVFERANIMTAFAVPICTGNQASPVGVVSCYSMIQSGSVPFVLRFVQQALHLLWSGLDKVQPHQSLGQDMWQDVGPADLGEMAADMEMQRHFIKKKRPHNSMDDSDRDPHTASLSAQLHSIDFNKPNQPQQPHHQQPQHQQLSTNHQLSQPSAQPSQAPQNGPKEGIPEYFNFQQDQNLPFNQQTSVQAVQAFQNHIQDAVSQVGAAMPFSHSHVATTADGSKRAHVQNSRPKPAPLSRPAPLGMPHALPTHIIKSTDYRHGNEYGEKTETTHHINQTLQPAPPPQFTQNRVAGGHPQPSPAGHPQHYAPPGPGVAHTNPLQPHHPQFAQHAPGPGLPPAQNMNQPSAPSRLSQNLLSQGMLQSIANQQYQFSYQGNPAPPNQHQSHAVPQYGASAAPPSSTSGMAMAPPHQQSAAAVFCPPANTGYPAPDLAHSAVDHAAPVMANGGKSKVKLCRIQGCDDPSVIRRPYCTRHSGNRLCEHAGCPKCAQGSTRFCIAHGGGRRCTFAGCDKGARDKFFCAAHGGGKRCKSDGCNKSAVGGSSLCTAHGGGRRCDVDGCDKSAQSSTKFCVKHGGGKKCCQDGCEKVARGRTQYCAAHGGGVRCKLNGCNRVAIGKMQLCRAHGGGSRARTTGSDQQQQEEPASIDAAPMFASTGNMDIQQDLSPVEFSTAASV